MPRRDPTPFLRCGHVPPAGRASRSRAVRRSAVASAAMRARHLVLIPLLAACGGAPEPVPTTPSPAASEATGPVARIVEARGTPGDTMKVVVIFENPTRAPCAIPTYTLRWPGGTKVIELGDFVIPPGETRQRSVKAHPDDGDLTSLQATTATIELPPTCR